MLIIAAFTILKNLLLSLYMHYNKHMILNFKKKTTTSKHQTIKCKIF
jgi:hypothetical protein